MQSIKERVKTDFSAIGTRDVSALKSVMDQARTDLALREMSSKIKRHFDTIERRMHKRQRMWGGNLSVLNQETEKRSNAARRTLAFERIMTEMPIAIEAHDVLVGQCIVDDTIVRCTFPRYILNEELGKCSVQLAHKCPDYDTLLKRGLRDIINELKRRRPEAEAAEFADERRIKIEFIENGIREAESVIALSHRYADLAEEMSEKEENPARKGELLEIAAVCRYVPEYPARSLQEAAQAVWLVNYVLFESMTHISIGRIDQVLNPYFEMDWKAGRITLSRAQEIVDSFVLHCNDRAQLDPKLYAIEDQKKLEGAPEQNRIVYDHGFVTAAETDHADAINHWGQNILLSGLLPDGGDATGVLTYLFLNAHQKFSMTSPVLTVRMHKNTPPELLERAAEVLKTGGGMPYINNDDIIVPAWESMGVAREDACKYANSNCWEILIQGMSNQEMIRGLNFLYFLELALNRGKPFIYGEQLAKEKPSDRHDPITFGGMAGAVYNINEGVDTGDAANFKTFEELMHAWKLQADCMLQKSMEHINRDVHRNGSHGPLSSFSFLSTLTQGCVEKLTDVTHQGAKYDLWHLNGEAVSNAADAAAAIRKFVYEEKLITLPRLVEVLKGNWAGAEGKALRGRFSSDAPKFGNNDDYVDSIAQEMVGYFVDRGAYHAKKFPKFIFSPSIGTYSWIISIGKKIGASADGRESQDPIASNMSPVPGKDVSGPTAAINSYWKLNTKTMGAGAPIDLRLNSNGLEGEEGTQRVAGLIKTFLEGGGNMMTLTITSVEDLKNAMKNPDKYRGLRVRMGGWSAYYVLLSKASQKIHLTRVEHGFV
ncbi:glycyl radical enzyme [Spirochaetia bacterium]|nr:glycyl radical enzyme [Spirochaetia bacterium]